MSLCKFSKLLSVNLNTAYSSSSGYSKDIFLYQPG